MRKSRRRKPKRLLPKFITFLALAVGLYVLTIAAGGDRDALPEDAASPALSNPLPLDIAPGAPPEGFPHFTARVSTAHITDTQYLKLVNHEHPIGGPVNPERLVTIWPDIPARASYVTLHETAFQFLRDLFAAAQNANFGSLFVASGFRSQEEQRALYEGAADRSYVMPPGHSEHQLGLAVDILSSDTASMRGSGEARWLAENAPAFGFILRYPEGRTYITGTPYEPWHFRYVGRVHAWYMGKQNFVLEEYIAYLQCGGGFQANFDGRTYYVLYQRPENGMIFVPEHLSFYVSSANTGGYIVTAWR